MYSYASSSSSSNSVNESNKNIHDSSESEEPAGRKAGRKREIKAVRKCNEEINDDDHEVDKKKHLSSKAPSRTSSRAPSSRAESLSSDDDEEKDESEDERDDYHYQTKKKTDHQQKQPKQQKQQKQQQQKPTNKATAQKLDRSLGSSVYAKSGSSRYSAPMHLDSRISMEPRITNDSTTTTTTIPFPLKNSGSLVPEADKKNIKSKNSTVILLNGMPTGSSKSRKPSLSLTGEIPPPIGGPKIRPKLSLEDIKAGLGVSGALLSKGSRQRSSSNTSLHKKMLDDSRDRQNSFFDENLPPLPQYQHDPSTVKLLNLCLELLEFTQLLEHSRSETAREWTDKSQAVRQLERLYDSVRDREAQFRDKIEEQRRKFLVREEKYFNLRKRARQHLREWQDDRDRFADETFVSNEKIHHLEAEMSHVTQVISEQKVELSDLRIKAKNMPSEKETTDYNLKLRSLQNENAQLLTQGATLKSTLDELAAQLQKRLPNLASEVANTVALLDDLIMSRSSTKQLDDSKSNARSRIAVEIDQLEKLAEEEQQKLEMQNAAFEAELEELHVQYDEFLEYKTALESMANQRPPNEDDDKEETEVLT